MLVQCKQDTLSLDPPFPSRTPFLVEPPISSRSRSSPVIPASTLSAPFVSHVQSKPSITLPLCSSLENGPASAQNVQRGVKVREEDWSPATLTQYGLKTSAELRPSSVWSLLSPSPSLHGPAAFQPYSILSMSVSFRTSAARLPSQHAKILNVLLHSTHRNLSSPSKQAAVLIRHRLDDM